MDAAVVLAAMLPPLVAYVVLLNPTVPAGDSGELVTVARTLGVAHPPGYPLYTWLGHLWAAAVPWGSVAWRMNLMSAVCAAFAAGLLASTVRTITRSAAAALVAAWTLAFSTPLWKYAEVAEVFALNALLAAAVLFLTARILATEERGDRLPDPDARAASPWPHAALAFVAALALSHHHTLALLLVPVVAVVLALQLGPRRLRAALGLASLPRLRGRDVAIVAVAGIAGLLPLAHLAVRHDSPAAFVWGDPGTLRGFLRQLLRVEYGSLRLDPLEAGMRADRSHVLLYLGSLPRGVGWLAIILALAGVLAVWRTRRALAIVLAGFALLQALFFTRVGFPSDVPLLRGVVERFYILPNLVIALLAGFGAALVLGLGTGAPPRPPRSTRSARGRAIGTPVRDRRRNAHLVGAALAIAAIAWPLSTHARLASQRGNRFTENLARTVLASVPPNAVLFVSGDLFHNGLQYLMRVEGLRPDVVVVDQALMTYEWYLRRLREAHPDVLPVLGRGERIRLGDGTVVEGHAIPRADGTTDLLVADGQRTVPSSAIAAIEPVADPSSLFAGQRGAFRRSWLLPMGEDRYSGLPGTRNLLWLDHLAGRRPVAFIGFKDDSWALRYEMIPVGIAVVAYPRGRAPSMSERIERMLGVAADAELGDYFRPFDPWSFEATERQWLAEMEKRSALLLCQPEAVEVLLRPRARAGRERVLAFARRFEALEPTPDPACLQAIGLLRMFDRGFRDPGQARRDLERYLATNPQGAEADEARRVLQGIPNQAWR